MASSIAAAPVIINQQQPRSLNPTNHHPSNRQRRRNNENENSEDRSGVLMGVIFIFVVVLTKFGINYIFISLNNLEEFSSYYKIEAFIILILYGFLCYVVYDPRKLYIMKNVLIIFGILFILELVMIAIIAHNKCYPSNENGVIKLEPEYFDCQDIINPVASSFLMYMSSIFTLLIYYLIKHQ